MSEPTTTGSGPEATPGPRERLLDLAAAVARRPPPDPRDTDRACGPHGRAGRGAGTGSSGPQAAHLAESAVQAARALSEPHHGLLTAARERLEAAAVRAEAKAPVATGVVWRLIDLLSEIGI